MTSPTRSNVEDGNSPVAAGPALITTAMSPTRGESASPAQTERDVVNIYGDALDANNSEDGDNSSYNEDEGQSMKQSLLRRAEKSHSRLPGIRKIPLRAIGIIV